MKRTAALILSLVLLFGLVAVAETPADGLNASAGLLKASTFFDAYSNFLTAGSGGIFYIDCYTEAVTTVAEVGVKTYDIYAKAPGGSWSLVDSYVTGITRTDLVSCSWSRTYQGVPNYQYYIVARHYCRKYDGTSATTTLTSNTITAK